MSQKKFKRMPYGTRKRKKQPPKTRKPKPSYSTKDVAINLRAREIATRRMDQIFEMEYYSKYPHGKKPYGFETGISMEEWKMDCKKIEDKCDGIFDEQLKRLSELVDDHWMNQPVIQSLLVKKLPIVIERLIKKFAATTHILEPKRELMAFYHQ